MSMLADLISISRIFLAYPLYQSMLSQHHTVTFMLLGWMILSDMLDGLVARHFGFSILGKWIDPFADAVGVFAWVLGLLKMNILSWHWVAFWCLRYLFFTLWAVWKRLRYGYYISAGVWNKISIVCLVLFLFVGWWQNEIACSLGMVLIVCQLLSIGEALIAPSPIHAVRQQI